MQEQFRTIFARLLCDLKVGYKVNGHLSALLNEYFPQAMYLIVITG
jgi:hypothetical protein